jgi:hypothetical protein
MSTRANRPWIEIFVTSPIRTPAITTGEPTARREPSRNSACVAKPPPTVVLGTRERIHRTATVTRTSTTATDTRRDSQRIRRRA